MTLLEITATDPATGQGTGQGTERTDIVRARAAFLREVAEGVDPMLAYAIRRRAAELELTAWVLAVRDEGRTSVP